MKVFQFSCQKLFPLHLFFAPDSRCKKNETIDSGPLEHESKQANRSIVRRRFGIYRRLSKTEETAIDRGNRRVEIKTLAQDRKNGKGPNSPVLHLRQIDLRLSNCPKYLFICY